MEKKKEEKFGPKLKADERISYEMDGKKEYANYTNFEFLNKQVAILQRELLLMSKVINQNGLTYTEEWSPEEDKFKLEDEIYEELDKDY
jgi:hypothetical protein